MWIKSVIVAVAALVTYLVFASTGETVEPGAVRRAVKCHKPKIDNGIIAEEEVKEEYNFGEYVKVLCNKEYRLIGSDRLRCSDDGQWSDNPPYCEVVTCPRPVQIMNGSIELKEPANIRSVARFSCSPGFTLIGRSELVCGLDGKWIPDSMPRCEVIQCPGFPDIKGLKANKQPAVGDNVQFSCDEGILVGNPVLYCAKNSSWVPNAMPYCECDYTPYRTTSHVYMGLFFALLGLLVVGAVAVAWAVKTGRISCQCKKKEFDSSAEPESERLDLPNL